MGIVSWLISHAVGWLKVQVQINMLPFFLALGSVTVSIRRMFNSCNNFLLVNDNDRIFVLF